MGYSIRTNTRLRNSTNTGWEKQCVALDRQAASTTKQNNQAVVFATNAMRELVPLPGTEDGYPIHYHSLIVETGANIMRFREFVVMHGDYVYPEYIVAYRRVIVPPGAEPEPEPELELQLQKPTQQSISEGIPP